MVRLELLLMHCKLLHIFRKLPLILFGVLGGLLELLVLLLVLLEDLDELLFLFLPLLSLLFVLLHLLFDFFGLGVDLGGERGLDIFMLPVLLVQLLSHEGHLFCALFLELGVLGLQLVRLFADKFVFSLRLRHITCHLRLDSFQMLVEVEADFFAFLGLLVGDGRVPLLELAVLGLVLTCDLLVLLADHFSLGATVLMLERLLVEELLVDLRGDAGRVDLTQKKHHLLGEEFVQLVGSLLDLKAFSLTLTSLELSNSRNEGIELLFKAHRLLAILVRLAHGLRLGRRVAHYVGGGRVRNVLVHLQ